MDDAQSRKGSNRISERTEEAVGEIAQALLDHPLLGQAIHAAEAARDRAMSAQRSAMHALDVSSAAEVERLERRLRALADRVEQLEDEVDALKSKAQPER
jgi:hypothetical protein